MMPTYDRKTLEAALAAIEEYAKEREELAAEHVGTDEEADWKICLVYAKHVRRAGDRVRKLLAEEPKEAVE